MISRRHLSASSLGILAGLLLAASPLAEAGGRGGHGFRGVSSHHGSHRSRGRVFHRHSGHPVGHHRGSVHHHGGLMRRTAFQSIPYRFHFSHPRTYSSPYSYYPTRRYYPRRSYPVYVAPPYYGGSSYIHGTPTFERLEAPAYLARPAVSAPQQPIIIIIQQPAAPAPAYQAPPPPLYQPPAANPNTVRKSSDDPGRVYLFVDPPASEVYLDNDFLGVGNGFDEPLELAAGVHILEVEHASYPAERLVFSVPADDEILVEIDLKGDRRGRKAWLRIAGEVEARLQLLRR